MAREPYMGKEKEHMPIEGKKDLKTKIKIKKY
jgi:hypothetical protein